MAMIVPIKYSTGPSAIVVGKNIYGGNTILGGAIRDLIYGESTGTLYAGSIGSNTIFGGGGSNTIYGDAYGLYGTVHAAGNMIWADSRAFSDVSALNTIYGNAYVMGGGASAGGNVIHDSYGYASYLYGNAYLMQDYAVGGHNTIIANSTNSCAYGDAYQINTAWTMEDHGGHPGLSGGLQHALLQQRQRTRLRGCRNRTGRRG
jgi:hypothetical protein